ncbi:heptaprenyl diphosphate synthase component 1 [Shimazuella sp. AN120528]|uniref:heptaprenyl diphosphate synthase component 1 n=1 Tax=Shimazuella soli TaxID=1892854 RepID=UPI001F0E9675|nr:heptaprenyl diphosphate synthase component 1 [Shimazuella soli]MCH5586459.1 heptaprenyl diphosphate synthase component 1 [Shimazuella soli]
MTSIHKTQEEIILHLNQLTGHSYLLEKCGRPKIPKLFIKILQLMLTSIQEKPQRIISYCVSTALLRMGIVVHEQVSLEDEKDVDVFQKKQLSILAGDYYSSLFYKTLAHHNEIEGMQVLSRTASQICEANMQHHIDGTFDPFKQEDWTGHQLLTALADFFHVHKQVEWCSLLSYYLHLDHHRTPKMGRAAFLKCMESIEPESVQSVLYQMLLDKEAIH